jgi:hypothetical protein
MKEIHGSTGFWRRGGEVVFSSLLVPFGSFFGIIFLFFDFNGCREFSIAISFTVLFSQIHRTFFLYFTYGTVISNIHHEISQDKYKKMRPRIYYTRCHIQSLFYLPRLKTLSGRISSFLVLTDITNF